MDWQWLATWLVILWSAVTILRRIPGLRRSGSRSSSGCGGCGGLWQCPEHCHHSHSPGSAWFGWCAASGGRCGSSQGARLKLCQRLERCGRGQSCCVVDVQLAWAGTNPGCRLAMTHCCCEFCGESRRDCRKFVMLRRLSSFPQPIRWWNSCRPVSGQSLIRNPVKGHCEDWKLVYQPYPELPTRFL